ncbi:MAG: carboxypeptidase regulatory-like domain-containing protein, partial [Prevotella sp.]|nr:carboxypeptidase regulatory-like domain-containing protein [Prevotella sp.]
MRFFLTLVLLSITLLCAHAQEENSKLTISGRLTDVDSKEPMEMATIQLFWANDTSFVGGTLSNEKGNFSLEAPSNGTY